MFAIIMALCALGIILKECYHIGNYGRSNDTISVRVDSVRDTVFIIKHDTVPIVKREKVLEYIEISPDELDERVCEDCTVPDSSVVLPIVQKEYTDDSTYTAYVSGIKYQNWPKLDSISVKSKLITNTIHETITVQKKKSPWGISVTAGPTVDAVNGKIGAGISIGLSYTIFNF